MFKAVAPFLSQCVVLEQRKRHFTHCSRPCSTGRREAWEQGNHVDQCHQRREERPHDWWRGRSDAIRSIAEETLEMAGSMHDVMVSGVSVWKLQIQISSVAKCVGKTRFLFLRGEET